MTVFDIDIVINYVTVYYFEIFCDFLQQLQWIEISHDKSLY